MKKRPLPKIRLNGIRSLKNTFVCSQLFVLIGLLLPFQLTHSEQEDSTSQKATELESVRDQIRNVESDIKIAREEVVQLSKELQQTEIAASKVKERLDEIDDAIENKVIGLAKLNVDKKTQEIFLRREQGFLAQQLRAAYIAGQNDYIKLLLNQEDPELVGRMLVYYDYYNRARSERITTITTSLQEIDRLKIQIFAETNLLSQLKGEQIERLDDFSLRRVARKQILVKLQTSIDAQGEQLQTLQTNAQELEALINQIQQQESIVQTFEDIPPFDSLRGKLNWPVRGRHTSRYGALRKGGKLKWEGVTIAAITGSDVEAISPGKVVFADWFQNMGLMLILDHGDGYMSLYGHNERLLKKVGDWVSVGDIISKVGDTGGQINSNLYFEIRQKGDPVNPGLWCKLYASSE